MKLLRKCHRAIMLVTEGEPWWLRPLLIVGWWLQIAPKLPGMLLEGEEEDDR